MRPAIALMIVDLPAPDGPNSAETPGLLPNSKPASSSKAPEAMAQLNAAAHCPMAARARRAMTSASTRPASASRNRQRRAGGRQPLRRRGSGSRCRWQAAGVRVSPGMLETKVMMAPNSPRQAAKAVTAPARMPGSASGRYELVSRSSGPRTQRFGSLGKARILSSSSDSLMART